MSRAGILLLFVAGVIAPQSIWSHPEGHRSQIRESQPERLPRYLIRLPRTVQSVFVAETSAAQFHRYERSGNGVVYGGSGYMSIGEGGPGKQIAGDRRTPLGVYFITEELDTSRLHEKYGVSAFPLDYPNAWDKRKDRTGDGIWVHGVDRRGGKRPPRDTDGCIALPNQDLAELSVKFESNRTPVLITRNIDWSDAAGIALQRVELEELVERWADSIASGDMHRYLSLYDDDFERWEMSKSEWASFSIQTLADRPIEKIAIDDLLLLGYPEVDGLYLSRFQQIVVEGENERTSTKRLYWRRNSGGELRIIAEDNG